MMDKLFVRCMGKSFCIENEEGCRTCGRSQEEIYATRALVDELVKFSQQMGYQNTDSFFEYIASKATKKANYLQKQVEAKELLNNCHEYH